MPRYTEEKDFVKWAQAITNVEVAGLLTKEYGVDFWNAVKEEYKALGGRFKGLKYN